MRYKCKTCGYAGSVDVPRSGNAKEFLQQFSKAARENHRTYSPACSLADLREEKMTLIVFDNVGITTIYRSSGSEFVQCDAKYIGYCTEAEAALIRRIPKECEEMPDPKIDCHVTHLVCTGVILE